MGVMSYVLLMKNITTFVWIYLLTTCHATSTVIFYLFVFVRKDVALYISIETCQFSDKQQQK